MSVTYGFYNSLNGDRKYNTYQLSSIFDGIIVDGVFASIGSCFVAKATTDLTINVGVGKAWFRHTWIYNDAILPIKAPPSEVLLNRIDALVMEFNNTEETRANDIKWVTGTPASNPSRPTLIDSDLVLQKPICYVYRKAESSTISQSDITNMIGTPDTPFVTGILQTVSIEELIGQWEAQLDEFVADETSDFNSWETSMKTQYIEWFTQFKIELETALQSEKELLDQWIQDEQSDFLVWFNEMKGQLSDDAAGNLQNQIDKEKVKTWLTFGFPDGVKSMNDEGTIIFSVSSDGYKLEKKLGNEVITTILYGPNTSKIAELVKTFSPDGKIIESAITYFK